MSEIQQVMSEKGGIFYNKEDVLGVGGFATVYKGKYRGKDVAVKVFATIATGGKQALDEIQVLQLSGYTPHPNVLRCFHIHEEEGYILLALEHCHLSLKQWVKSKGECVLPATTKHLEICSHITAGLQYLHQLGIVHRDLKPENILLARVSESKIIAKVADFGLSKILPDARSSVTMNSIAGTKGWMAPEMLAFQEGGVDKENKAQKTRKTVDIFSLGCLLYFVLTDGQHPFGESDIKRQIKILRSSSTLMYRSSCKFKKQISFIRLMIDRDPESRPEMHVIAALFCPEEYNFNSKIQTESPSSSKGYDQQHQTI